LEVLDNKKLKFSVKIPQDAVEKAYILKVIVYEEDGDVFENGADDDLAEFTSSTFEVEGSCIGSVANVGIVAELDPETPEAVPGKQIIVKATLTNKGDAEATYTVSVEGNSAWSNLVAIDPQVVTLGAGESKVVNLILGINSDAEGDKEFVIKVTSADGRTTSQTVRVSIEGTTILKE